MTSQLLAYDSTRPELIPADAAVVLYYGDGRYAWTAEDLKRFPAARRRAGPPRPAAAPPPSPASGRRARSPRPRSPGSARGGRGWPPQAAG